jgi:hypothetical protein
MLAPPVQQTISVDIIYVSMDYVLKSNQAKSAQKLTNAKVLIVRKMVAQEAMLTVCCQTVLRARTVTSVHLIAPTRSAAGNKANITSNIITYIAVQF